MNNAQNIVTINGCRIRVSKYHSRSLAIAATVGANGTTRQNAWGHGGAQRVVLGDVDDPHGAYWVAACNRDSGALVAAGHEYL